MAGTAEFDEFVMARSRHLLRIAYLLTGDHALAEDLLQTALVKSWSAWRRIHGDPEPYVRQVLVNTYRSWWRRRWNGERPTDVLPEQPMAAPQSAVDERDEVWRALGRLSRQQRVVLVLRYFEDLTEAEIAQALGISPGSVKSYAAKGLARLRVDPDLQALPLPGEDAPAGNERLVAVRERVAQQRRAKLASVAAACAVVLAGIAGYAIGPGRGPDQFAGVPDFHQGYRIVERESASFAAGQSGFTMTPSTLDLAFFPACTHSGYALPLIINVWINGRSLGTAECDTRGLSFDARLQPAPDTLRDAGVEIGKPMAVTYSLDVGYVYGGSQSASSPTPGPAPADGVLAVLVGEAVPFGEVPLPERPATLAPLSRPAAALPGSVLITADGPRTGTYDWQRGGVRIMAAAQTPGVLRVLINGVPVDVKTWWDYEQAVWQSVFEPASDDAQRRGLSLSYPDELTISVEAEHMTGDWFVAVMPAN
ncbi:SigE family RNA polymerase sigma factor [Catellatospora sp. IY07-71]|uniref:SigE family RNA polymerase sigma factor n=1 Tax=Catellatospora sp. IY07-71 TaxID=2728827 RepID=UPI001BB42D7B|nr:SigE family RNA polymerase sigma factor [Catellatospora sp. IY07-71]